MFAVVCLVGVVDMAADWSPGPAEIMGEEEFTKFREECLKDSDWNSVVKNEKCQVFTKKVFR